MDLNRDSGPILLTDYLQKVNWVKWLHHIILVDYITQFVETSSQQPIPSVLKKLVLREWETKFLLTRIGKFFYIYKVLLKCSIKCTNFQYYVKYKWHPLYFRPVRTTVIPLTFYLLRLQVWEDISQKRGNFAKTRKNSVKLG